MSWICPKCRKKIESSSPIWLAHKKMIHMQKHGEHKDYRPKGQYVMLLVDPKDNNQEDIFRGVQDYLAHKGLEHSTVFKGEYPLY